MLIQFPQWGVDIDSRRFILNFNSNGISGTSWDFREYCCYALLQYSERNVIRYNSTYDSRLPREAFVGCKERPMTQDLHVVCSFAVHCIMMYLVNGKMGVFGWGKKTLKYYQSAHGLWSFVARYSKSAFWNASWVISWAGSHSNQRRLIFTGYWSDR